jgi:hypothetical protein
MAPVNPYPDYPVARLQDDAAQATRATADTPAIQVVKGYVREFISQWTARRISPEQRVSPMVVGVRGDYGSGKTHLLLCAAAEFERGLVAEYPDATLLRVQARDADPAGWYRSAVGPALTKLVSRGSPSLTTDPEVVQRDMNRLRALVVEVYAASARRVANEASLTEAVSRKLAEQPRAVLRLVRDGLLNETAVDEEFRRDLQRLCPNSRPGVLRALTGLVWPESVVAALRWLAGENLSEHERGLLRVEGPLTKDEEVADVLSAVAVLHETALVPFGLMIDEAEQMLRPAAEHARQNAPWLKSAIESLADHSALVFVAGHNSAWGGPVDLLQRFSPPRIIDLRSLTGEQVLRLIVKARVRDAAVGLPEAEIIAEAARGNTRQVFTLCRALFDQTGGFVTPLTPESIRETAERIGQRVSIEEASARCVDILTTLGTGVRRGTVVGGSTFDLAAYREDKPLVVADFRHAVTPYTSNGDAWQFKDKLEAARRSEPQVVGCFVSAGSPDQAFLAALRQDGLVLLTFDLNRADVFDRMREELVAHLSGGAGSQAPPAVIAALKEQNEQLQRAIEQARRDRDTVLERELRQQRANSERRLADVQAELTRRNQKLEEQLQALDQARAAEVANLRRQLESVQADLAHSGDGSLVTPPGEIDPRVHDVYRELTGRLTFWAAFRFALSPPSPVEIDFHPEGPGPVSSWYRLRRYLRQVLLPLRRYRGWLLLLLSGGALAFGYFAPQLLPAPAEAVTASYVAYGIAAVGASTLMIGFWLRVTQGGVFFEQAARVIRHLYLANASPNQLLLANDCIHDLLELRGPTRAVWLLRQMSRHYLDRSGPRAIDGFLKDLAHEARR